MDKGTAESVISGLRAHAGIELVELEPAIVENFHGWARGKEVMGVFRCGPEANPLHVLIMVWRPKKPDQFYCVVYGNTKGAPLLEAHHVEAGALQWRYAPKARDGKNDERQEAFRAELGDVDVSIPLPEGNVGVSEFLESIARVVAARRAADDAGKAAVAVPGEPPAAWIFQANPTMFDLEAALGVLLEMTWLANQHAEKIAPGQRVFLWQSGKSAGVLATATVLTQPALLLRDAAEEQFVRDAEAIPAGKALRVRVRVDDLLDEPLSRDVVREDPRLAGLSFLRAPQGTNFPVTKSEEAALLDLIKGERAPRVVKIAPGAGAKYWDDCLANGYIRVGWDDVGDLSAFSSQEEFAERFSNRYDYGGHQATATKKARELWTLMELRPGDIVIANKGTTEVLGVGKVVAPPYRWLGDKPKFNHSVSVEWDTSVARRIPKQSYWGTVTICDVPAQLYRDIVKPTASSIVNHQDGTPFLRICAAIDDAGLNYSREVISAYLLALQAKRLVILTGISGTGKTQLALTAAKLLGRGTRARRRPKVPEGAYAMTVRPYMLKYNRLVLPAKLMSAARFPGQGSNDGFSVEVLWPGGKRNLTVGAVMKQGARQLLFSGSFRQWFQSNFSTGEPFYLELVETNEDAPHQLRVGMPKQVLAEEPSEDRYTVVAVRPDWTDNRGLLGYYNPILQEYVSTDFLRLLLRAHDEFQAAQKEGRSSAPYFVILDEMNLARVEYYFSDFLSALESGEPLLLHNDDDVESGEKSDDLAIPKKLAIPGNLFFTGTVNVDETTYMFSPKVLDRAYVMELNLVDLEGFGKATVAGSEDAPSALSLTDMPDPIVCPRLPCQEDWEHLGALADSSLAQTVIDLHRLLVRFNRHFGYRVANEIARFVVLAGEQTEGADTGSSVVWTALDLAILFKVLPKLHGTQQELADLLAALFAFATSGQVDEAGDPTSAYDLWRLDRQLLHPRDESGLEPAVLPRTAAKLWRMADRLTRQGFTSFIE